MNNKELKEGYVIKYGEMVYLYHNANIFTPRLDRARRYKTLKGAKRWINKQKNDNYLNLKIDELDIIEYKQLD